MRSDICTRTLNGNGPMLQGVPQFIVTPSGIIVAGAFFSIRDYGGRASKIYRVLARFSLEQRFLAVYSSIG